MKNIDFKVHAWESYGNQKRSEEIRKILSSFFKFCVSSSDPNKMKECK